MEKKKVLITGGAGFFGELLKRELLDRGHSCVSIDLQSDPCRHERLTAVRGDVRDRQLLETLAREGEFDVVYHLAAVLAHAVKDEEFLWSSNVEGTRNVAWLAEKFRIPKVVFLSSNCLWGNGFDRPVGEEEPPCPVELYGRSKWEAEKILGQWRDAFHAVIFRCPTIVDAGRLGLLSILFEFIDEGRRVWVVGRGENRYQFIYARDLIDACLGALAWNESGVFNVGSDNVPSMTEAYRYVIERAETGARVAHLPAAPTLAAMRAAHALRLSPLGPYQYKMIAENFVFDTAKIKRCLGWKPTLDNREMLYKAYSYFHDNKLEIGNRTGVSAHKRASGMGIIRVLKWFS